MKDDRGSRNPAKTVTRADLAEAVHARIGLPRTECARIVETVLSLVCDAAVRGEHVKLSSFGTFVLRQKGERVGRNPKTGEAAPISPRRVMTFRPSHILRATVERGRR